MGDESQDAQPANKEKSPGIKTETDPKAFLRGFYESRWYEDAFARFFEGKTLDPNVTKEDKKRTFFEDDEAKFALIDYGVNDVHLRHNPYAYPENSREAIQNYVAFVKEMIDLIRKGIDKDQIITLDEQRFKYHEEVGKKLVEDGIAPSEKMGRALGSLILIDKGLESPQAARRPDIERIERKLGIKSN